MVLHSVGCDLLRENRMLGFLANLFWPDHVSAFNPLVPGVH